MTIPAPLSPFTVSLSPIAEIGRIPQTPQYFGSPDLIFHPLTPVSEIRLVVPKPDPDSPEPHPRPQSPSHSPSPKRPRCDEKEWLIHPITFRELSSQAKHKTNPDL